MERKKRAKAATAKNIAYLRVSTNDQDTEKNKVDILGFVNDRAFGQVEFIEEKVSGSKNWKERKIQGIINVLGKGDRLIVPEMSRLGRSLLDVMSILAAAKEKGIAVYDVKNGWDLNGSLQSEVMAMVLSIAAQVERELIRKRTGEGLRAAKARGVILGRPKGPGKSKLDPHKEEIIALLKTGSRKNYIAKKYSCTPANLWNWLKRNNIQDVKAEF